MDNPITFDVIANLASDSSRAYELAVFVRGLIMCRRQMTAEVRQLRNDPSPAASSSQTSALALTPSSCRVPSGFLQTREGDFDAQYPRGGRVSTIHISLNAMILKDWFHAESN